MTNEMIAGLPPVEIELADAMRRVGEAALGRTVDHELAAEVTRRLNELSARLETCPRRSKEEAFAVYPGHQRGEHFAEHGRWPDPVPDGQELIFDALSFVGGPLSPFRGGARFYRDGDETVAKGRISICYEGPPGRIHGGMIASVFDEVMSSVFRVQGMASAFTATLSVRYVAPAPIDTDVELRARLANSDGRKHTIEATATGPDGTFAEATGLFIEPR